MKQQLLNLTHYNLWANARVCEFLKSISEEQRNTEIVSSFSSVKKTLYHTWGAQAIWLKRLQGSSPTSLPYKDFSGSFQEAMISFLQVSEELIDFVESADEELLRSLLTYKTIDGTEYKNDIGDIIQHVVNHSTFHRGQLITMLRQLGYTELFDTDYIAWCRE